MTTKPTAEDLKPIVDQLEDNLRQLRVLLEALPSESPNGSQGRPLLGGQEKSLDESDPDPGPAENCAATAESGSAGTSMEPEEFIQEVEKLQLQAETMDRLTLVERQNRRLTLLGGLVLTIMLLSISIIAFLVAHPESWYKVP